MRKRYIVMLLFGLSFLSFGQEVVAHVVIGDVPHMISSVHVFFNFLLIGFRDVFASVGGKIPYGVSHLVFIAGLFFSRQIFKSTLMQMLCFTLAYSITLSIGRLDIVSIHSSAVFMPLTGLAIIVIAVENIVLRKPYAYRWVIVAFFGIVFGFLFEYSLFIASRFFVQDILFYRVLVLIAYTIGTVLAHFFFIGVLYCLSIPIRKHQWYQKYGITMSNVFIVLLGLIIVIDHYGLFEWGRAVIPDTLPLDIITTD